MTSDFSGIKDSSPLPSVKSLTLPAEMQELMDEYIQSTLALLHSLEEVALDIDSTRASEDNVQQVLRIIHTIKGEAGIVGLTAVSDFSHETESAVPLLEGEALTDMLLRYKDWICDALEWMASAKTSV
ncbi:MAG: hypothetical protein GY835_07660 [bacterium]|nr:hypothetical protein [bacterium]